MGLEIDGVSGIIKNTTSDGDVTIKGNDGGSEVTAMSFDMSAAGIATLTAGLKLTGTTPTLTVGDGGAEDAKILFDGNAQNFHIGLDDSTDKLTIGLGNTLGTYPAITIDENTNVVIPDSSLTVIGTGNYDIITLKSTDADSNVGPVLNFTRDSSSPANNDFLGELTFQGDNNAGETHDYIRMFARILNVADGSEQADFIMKDATGNNIVNFAHSEVVYNDDSVDRDFRVESNGNANALFVNAGSDLIDFGVSGEGHLRPSFYASKDGTAQTIAADTNTLVTFNTELIDSDGKFASNRFTPTIAGYYFISSAVSMTNHPQNAYTQIRIKKNGNTDVFQELGFNHANSGEADTKAEASFIIYLDGDDYLEIFIRQNSGGNENTRTGHECRFMGYRIH